MSSMPSFPASNIRSFPGHEIVGRVDLVGRNVTTHRIGDRVGIPWLGYTCGVCRFCREGMENLCDRPLFTGYTRDGGFATHTIADARYAFPLGEDGDDVSIAPLLCAGLIGWRSLVMAGDAEAARHLWLRRGRAHRRPGRALAGPLGLRLHPIRRRRGAGFCPPAGRGMGRRLRTSCLTTPLDAAIIYAPAGELVPAALRAVRKGGRVVCAGIHMSDIPSFPYDLLWEERQLVSVANLTRQDGLDFLKIVAAGRNPDPDHGIPACRGQRGSEKAADGTNPRRRGAQTLGRQRMTDFRPRSRSRHRRSACSPF